MIRTHMGLSSAATIGILGGGQLGRMLAIEAKGRGFRCVIRTDEASGGPAAQVADGEFLGPYDDQSVNTAFAQACDVITAEFENLPAELLDSLAEHIPTRPGSKSLAICQHRRREKEFLAAHGFPHTPFFVVRSAVDLQSAMAKFQSSAILKTSAFGYDGKGQIRLSPNSDLADAWGRLDADEGVVEKFVDFSMEISVVGARGEDGQWVAFAPGENVHRNGVLDYTLAPARISAESAGEAASLARNIAESLDHVGTIAVEMFVLPGGSLLINEMAPRPHNSGHHTIEACTTSQFGQQWRAAVGAPLGDPTQHTPAVMLNLLGDLWNSGEPNWKLIGSHKNAHLHLYGKGEARPGRKMGHLTLLGPQGDAASMSEVLEELLAEGLDLRTELANSH
jgi:5-(carboxyamino)imidazole ribonucleotide synthase